MNKPEYPCKCGHIRKQHRGSNHDYINSLVEMQKLQPHPELVGYLDPNGKYFSLEDLENTIDALFSDCTEGILINECECKKFDPYNLAYLEDKYARESIIKFYSTDFVIANNDKV